jgi:SOS-response transcriptional repressor LexA
MTDDDREVRAEEVPVDEYLEVPDIFGGQEGDYILQVKGASFDGLAILEGDYLLVRPTDDPAKGAAVVAIQGDEDSTVVCGAEELPASAKLCGQVIGMMRKV